MGHGKRPGPDCHTRGKGRVKDGTLCKQPSATPGPSGLGSSIWSGLSEAWETAGGWVDSAQETAGRAGRFVSGHSVSLVLTLIDQLPVKQDSPWTLALLKHYVEGSGDPYVIDPIPVEWQDWIVKKTHGRPGSYADVNPYNSGLFDLRHSLGHFKLVVTRVHGGKTRYSISDTYQFGFRKNDRAQKGRHGFAIFDLSDSQLQHARTLLPSTKYRNPGGFDETWEIRRVGKETILFIPQQFLEEQGAKFPVSAVFDR